MATSAITACRSPLHGSEEAGVASLEAQCARVQCDLLRPPPQRLQRAGRPCSRGEAHLVPAPSQTGLEVRAHRHQNRSSHINHQCASHCLHPPAQPPNCIACSSGNTNATGGCKKPGGTQCPDNPTHRPSSNPPAPAGQRRKLAIPGCACCVAEAAAGRAGVHAARAAGGLSLGRFARCARCHRFAQVQCQAPNEAVVLGL